MLKQQQAHEYPRALQFLPPPFPTPVSRCLNSCRIRKEYWLKLVSRVAMGAASALRISDIALEISATPLVRVKKRIQPSTRVFLVGCRRLDFWAATSVVASGQLPPELLLTKCTQAIAGIRDGVRFFQSSQTFRDWRTPTGIAHGLLLRGECQLV